jgi:hypothetical protein
MLRRKKATIFTDAKESTTVHEVKRIVEGILKVRPEDQKLYKDDQVNTLLKNAMLILLNIVFIAWYVF